MTPETNSGADLIRDTTTQTFTLDVIQESQKQPVLVDFWAPWCGPCRQLTPMIEKAVNEASGRVKLVKMNIDDHPEVAGQMGVRSIPAVVAFKDGRPVDGFMGAVPESQIKEFIDKIAGPAAPSQAEEVLIEAQQLLSEEAFEAAAQHFNAVLQMEPDNVAAVAGLAASAIGLGEIEEARKIIETVAGDHGDHDAIKAVIAQLELIEKAADTGETGALLEKLANNPDDHQTRFDLALAYNASGKREDASKALLEIVARDRTWEDDGARKELLKFFEAWGHTDKATIAARRKLSSLLFS